VDAVCWWSCGSRHHWAWFEMRISWAAESLRLLEWAEAKAVLENFSLVEELHDWPF